MHFFSGILPSLADPSDAFVVSHPELLILFLFVESPAPGERVQVSGLLHSRPASLEAACVVEDMEAEAATDPEIFLQNLRAAVRHFSLTTGEEEDNECSRACVLILTRLYDNSLFT